MNPDVRLQPMVHVEEMAPAVALYEALGARLVGGSRDVDWVLLELGASQFSLLAHPANPEQGDQRVELNFQATDLTDLYRRLTGAGIAAAPPTDEGFGRQLQITTPDGLLLKVNELNRDLLE